MEPWAESIIDSVEIKGKIVDTSENIKLCTHEHMNGEHHHHHNLDPHIWSSPENAMVMVENIVNALCIADPQNGDFYRENAKSSK